MPKTFLERPPVLIGYLPKKIPSVTDLQPWWPKNAAARVIRSVSECISPGPENWISRWEHHPETMRFADPKLACHGLAEHDRHNYEIHACELYPFSYHHGRWLELEVPEIHAAPVPGDFEVFGYDVVCRSMPPMFDCSPLSCNGMAEKILVNESCLLDSLQSALDAAPEFEAAQCEPGPYCIVRVSGRALSRHDKLCP